MEELVHWGGNIEQAQIKIEITQAAGHSDVKIIKIAGVFGCPYDSTGGKGYQPFD